MTTSRRSFLGGLVATSALSALAADDPALFPSRGRFERLSLAYSHVKIGLERPFSVLHISDTHLTEAEPSESADWQAFAADRRKTFGGRQIEALRDSLAWAKENVDYVVHTGDLIDFQTRANLSRVRSFLGARSDAMFTAVGNHEYQRLPWCRDIRNTAEYNAPSRASLNAAFGHDTSFSSTVVHGVNFISLDQVYGFVSAEQVAFFKAEAKRALPIVLCMHVPFFTDHIWRCFVKYWSEKSRCFRSDAVPPPEGDYARQMNDPVTRDFLDYLRREPLLKAILAGHLHFDCEDDFSPTCREYVVGGNFMFHGREVFFS